MTPEQFAQAEATLSSLISQYQSVERSDIPETIVSAALENWELHLEDIQLAGTRLAYPTHQRKIDSRRLIRFGDAMAVLQAMEERLIDDICQDRGDLVFGILKSRLAKIKWLTENWNRLDKIFEAIGEVIDSGYRFAKEGLPVLIAHLTLAFVLPELAKTVVKVMAIRDTFPEVMRKKALPQRIVERRYRRKVSRL